LRKEEKAVDEVLITVIGAGVIGLSVAAELSGKYDSVVLLERHKSFGQETSSRNSEVIHSGIYYPADSLKASLCVEGADMLYAFCREFSIPHKELGKLIVAADEREITVVEDLLRKGTGNGVRDLAVLDSRRTRALEPYLNAAASLHSPHTGILDTHSLMRQLLFLTEMRGGLVSFQSTVEHLDREHDRFVIGIKENSYQFRSRVVINCAGLGSDRIARLTGIDLDRNQYSLKYCKGSYFSYAKPSPVKTLVYPVPHENLSGLGVHATLDLGNRLRFGPDVEYTDSIDYTVDAAKRDAFYEGAGRIIRGLDKEAFIPDMAGVRPKLSGPGERARDFIIREESENGVPGLINMIGIESPGLTACLSIARLTLRMVRDLLGD